MRKLVDLFFHVDDFNQAFISQWQTLQLETGERNRIKFETSFLLNQ